MKVERSWASYPANVEARSSCTKGTHTFRWPARRGGTVPRSSEDASLVLFCQKIGMLSRNWVTTIIHLLFSYSFIQSYKVIGNWVHFLKWLILYIKYLQKFVPFTSLKHTENSDDGQKAHQILLSGKRNLFFNVVSRNFTYFYPVPIPTKLVTSSWHHNVKKCSNIKSGAKFLITFVIQG